MASATRATTALQGLQGCYFYQKNWNIAEMEKIYIYKVNCWFSKCHFKQGKRLINNFVSATFMVIVKTMSMLCHLDFNWAPPNTRMEEAGVLRKFVDNDAWPGAPCCYAGVPPSLSARCGAHWLLNVQQVCGLTQPQSPIRLGPGEALEGKAVVKPCRLSRKSFFNVQLVI